MSKKEPKLPGTLKVGGMTFKVEINNDWVSGAEANAVTLLETLEIKLNDVTPLIHRQRTFIHEALHAIDSVYCNGATLTEQQVHAVAQGFLQVLHDNPEFVRFILAD